MKFDFMGTPVFIKGLEVTKYADGNPALIGLLQWGDDDYPDEQTLSINVPASSGLLGKDEFFIKNYSEAVEIYGGLISLGIITETGKTVQSGFVSIPVCKLTEKGKGLINGNS